MTKSTWSVNALADELGIDRRTVKKRLRDVPPAGKRGGHPVCYLADAMQAIAQAGQAKAAKAEAPPVPPGFGWVAKLEPTDACAALALMTLIYRLPPVMASLAVASGADCKAAFAMAETAKAVLPFMVAEAGRDLGLRPWATDDAPSFVALELFDETNWPALAAKAGEQVDMEAWQAWAQSRAA